METNPMHSSITLPARRNWISACEFHDLTSEAVLEEVAKRIQENNQPIVLLDLDSTLYEVTHRMHFILTEWAHHSASAHRRLAVNFPTAVFEEEISKMEKKHIGFSIRDTLINLKLIHPDLHDPGTESVLKEIRNFWSDRFFSGDYLLHDQPYPGAVDFVQKIYRLGAEIVYLTGRNEPKMGERTRANLARDGFPWNTQRTHLFMKPSADVDDLHFKIEAAHLVKERGKLVASFENEPPNLVALSEIFTDSDSMHVFVDTVCSEQGARPRKGLYRIQRFI
jgi:hypothetical protein